MFTLADPALFRVSRPLLPGLSQMFFLGCRSSPIIPLVSLYRSGGSRVSVIEHVSLASLGSRLTICILDDDPSIVVVVLTNSISETRKNIVMDIHSNINIHGIS
jgi:hypothetical protein